MPLPMITLNEDITSDNQYIPTGDYVGKTMTWLNPETGKYEQREIFDDYDSAHPVDSAFVEWERARFEESVKRLANVLKSLG